MEKEGGLVRFRVVFDDCGLLSKSQISDGFSRCWLLLKPGIATFADLASHLRKTFAFRERLVLYIDDFVLPPFESTRIIKDNDIIRVKKKDVKLKNSHKHCDAQNALEDNLIAKANIWAYSDKIALDETYQENSQQFGKNEEEKLVSHTENAVHEGNSSCDNVMMKQKRKKRLKESIAEKQVSSTKDALIDELQIDQINNHCCDPMIHITDDATKISDESCKFLKHEFKENFGEGNGHLYCNNKNSGTSSANGSCSDRTSEESAPEGAMPAKQRIDIDTLILLTRQPQEGDILAYRYVELSSAYLELSSPQVGGVSAFDRESNQISLIPVHEFEVFSKENSKSVVSQQRSSLYKQDGSLVINFSLLFDVRLLKGHDSNCEADFAESSWNPSNIYNADKGNGWSKSSAMETKDSSSTPYRASPAANFFWETLLSKGKLNKVSKHSGLGKY
ncbi:hypothetical protein HPP92_010991 [Vanilla planifolia]|uniref:Coilin n=2 Tax=Vanilla planifolia TaxID=51239 RepID=A0A835RBJ0_VANPL|nr:hypothetical protein HPP92_010991 [Vanilla planifolia]